MKTSINHFRNRTKQELNILVDLIKQEVKGCEMIILFGSYARGEQVYWDERFEFGTHTVYESDLDILVVVSNTNILMAENQLGRKVTNRYDAILNELRPRPEGSKVSRYAPPQFVAEFADTLNKELEESQYFFTDAIKDGIMLYDSGACKLAKPRCLSYKEIKKIAVKQFNITFPDAQGFLKIGRFCFKEGDYKLGSFQLHQACERYLNSVGLVFSNYKGKSHDLKKMFGKLKRYVPELVAVFPLNTDFEIRCFDLIWRAYVEARYNPKFVVTKEEYMYMLERTKILDEIVDRACHRQYDVYDKLIAKQSVPECAE